MARKKNISPEEEGLVVLFFLFFIFSLFFKGHVSFIAYLFILIVATFIFVLVARYVYKRKRDKFYESKDTLQKIRYLTPSEFESYIATLYENLGYKTQKVGNAYDGGIDVIAEKDGEKRYIQCKKFITSKVGVHDVRDFYGAMADKLSNAKGIFITTNIFTTEAEKFVEDKPIELIDGNSLIKLVKKVGGGIDNGSTVETCSQCGANLVKRTGKYGEFFGCNNYPKCKFTKRIT